MNPPSKPILDVGDEDFYEQVIQASHAQPIIVDFWSPGCPPCRMLTPLLEKLVAEKGGKVVLAKINVEDAQQVAGHYQIQAVPTVVAFQQGQPTINFEGLLPEEQLRQFVDELAGAGGEPEPAPMPKDPAEAEKELRAKLEKEPDNDEALVGLARVLVERGELEEAEPFLEKADATGAIGVEADRLRGLIFLERQAQALGTPEEIRQRHQADSENAQHQYELGCLLAQEAKYEEALATLLSAGEKDFKIAPTKVKPAMANIFLVIGPGTPLADSYRSKLAQLLY